MKRGGGYGARGKVETGGSRWQTTAQGRRYRDPLREIVDIVSGAGSDVLTFVCGHRATKNHRKQWGRRAGCHGCREWETQS